MSIITEALKKAERTSKKILTPLSLPDKPINTTMGAKRKDLKPSRRRILIAIIVFTAIVFSGVYFLDHMHLSSRDTIKQPRGDNFSSHDAAVDADAAYIVPSTPDRNEETLTARATISSDLITSDEISREIRLSGIMYTPKRPLAVINNAIWAKGERVGRFNISEIGRDFVKLESQGQEFIIKLKR